MSISVTRTTVVRVHHELDIEGCQQLSRILTDLIEHQGISDINLDLSGARHMDTTLASVLDGAQATISRLGGSLELRTPPEPTDELLRMVEDIAAFTPTGGAEDGPSG